MKRFWIPLSALFVFLFCILHPSEAVSGAAAGLSLWYCTVLPTLLPCMVLSGYLISTGLMEKMPPAPFAFLIGWFCGYPMGAKTIADLYKKRSILASSLVHFINIFIRFHSIFLKRIAHHCHDIFTFTV